MGVYPTSPNDVTLYPDKVHPATLGNSDLAPVDAAAINGLIARKGSRGCHLLKAALLAAADVKIVTCLATYLAWDIQWQRREELGKPPSKPFEHGNVLV
jgi:hypothetical protein